MVRSYANSPSSDMVIDCAILQRAAYDMKIIRLLPNHNILFPLALRAVSLLVFLGSDPSSQGQCSFFICISACTLDSEYTWVTLATMMIGSNDRQCKAAPAGTCRDCR